MNVIKGQYVLRFENFIIICTALNTLHKVKKGHYPL